MNLPNVHFGKVKEEKIDWRKFKQEEDPDDEELEVTPVIWYLILENIVVLKINHIHFQLIIMIIHNTQLKTIF